MVTWRLSAHSPPSLDTLILRMSFVDEDTLSLAGLDAPDFLNLDDSFSVSSSTAHCHSSCTTSACMKNTDRRSPKGARPIPVVATEEVCIDVHAGPPVLTSLPLHRITFRLRPGITATSSNLFHLFQQSLHSISQSSGTYAPTHPPLLTSPLPS